MTRYVITLQKIKVINLKLLFISNNIKIAAIKNKLQPLLKPRVNIEPDFDNGLNYVFEKRPEVVFIQDQIAGVTGESVARHIQMLLDEDAPAFIFMHNGDAEAKPIKGLYAHLIDLSQTEAQLLADIPVKLNLLLGPYWQKICVVPKTKNSAAEGVLTLPDESQGAFSQCLSDFIPELEPIGPAANTTIPPLAFLSDISLDESFHIISSTDDQLAEIVCEESRAQKPIESVAAFDYIFAPEEMSSPAASVIPAIQKEPSASLSGISKPAVVETVVAAVKPSSAPKEFVPVVKAASREQNSTVPAVVTPSGTENLHSLPGSPVGLKGEEEAVQLEAAQEGIPWAFEGEPFVKKSTWKWYQVVELLLVLCLSAGGWYLIKQKSPAAQSGAKEAASATAPSSLSPSSGAKKPVTAQAQQAETAQLPAIIPIAGLDPSFAAQNPGWERYVGKESEFRLFSSEGKLKAVQVTAAKGHVLSESLLKTILVELTGSGKYSVTSREEKLGFQLSHATANRKAELLIYSKKSALHAVVVSLN